MHRILPLLSVPLLATGCAGEGTWVLETWGESYIEASIPAGDFADGCEVVYDVFLVVDTRMALLDGDGEAVAEVPEARVYDMTRTGPHAIAALDVPATHYDTVRWRIAPAPDTVAGNATTDQVALVSDLAASVYVAGTLACGSDAVAFDWAFDTDTTYLCEPEDLTIPAGGEDGTQLTVHGDHLFYDGLENADAVVRGQAILDADADQDGRVTLEELAAMSVATLGYDVGSRSEVSDLGAFVAFLSRTLGHIDGEGHCQVDL
ncbi:MAG: hypothetical protein JXB39_12210 [Deltaproteobacteria bacterium]|nr:hypothetical protein [Deltaproteobacteria bacterium]